MDDQQPVANSLQTAKCELIADFCCVCIRVLTSQAVQNIEEIAAVEGLDSVCIGGNDLSGSLGFPYLNTYQLLKENPTGLQALDRVCAACSAAGVSVGVSTADVEMAVEVMKRVGGLGWINMGELGLADLARAVDIQYGDIKARL